MPLEDVLNLESGDYGGPMCKIFDGMDDSGLGHKGLTCQEYVIELAEDMIANGWAGPPVCVRMEAPAYWDECDKAQWLPTLANGHHRTMAAVLAGIEDVPVTDNWDVSEY